MTITLDPILQIAQDGLDHHPIIEIMSNQFASDIPFDGTYFDTHISGELHPQLLHHSSGRICGIYTREGGWAAGSNQRYMYFMTTDEDRQLWTHQQILDADPYDVDGVSVIELPDESLGIVFTTTNGYLKQMKIDVDGNVLSGEATIDSWDPVEYWRDSPNLAIYSGEEIMLVYPYGDLLANNGSGEYHLKYRTSSDFVSWGGEADINFPAASGEWDVMKKDHPFLVVPDIGNICLLYDYEDAREETQSIINIKMAESSDFCANFTSGENITNWDVFGKSSINPSADMTSMDKMKLAYHETIEVLTMDSSFSGFCLEDGSFCSTKVGPAGCHYDPATNKLYAYYIWTYTGGKVLCTVQVIDVATWTIDWCYSSKTTPGWNDLFTSNHVWYRNNKGAGHWVGIATCYDPDTHAALVINDSTRTIKEYFFEDYSATGAYKSVDLDMDFTSWYIVASQIDETNERLYIYWTKGYYYDCRHMLGWIDLNETADPATGKYTWHQVFHGSLGSGINIQLEVTSFMTMDMDFENDMVFFNYDTGNSALSEDKQGALRIHKISTGAQIKYYNHNDYSGFHKSGSQFSIYMDGFVYTSFTYIDTYEQQDRRGLLIINLANDSMYYVRPGFATLDSYGISGKISIGDGKIAMRTWYHGIQIYDTKSGSWEGFTIESTPGLFPDGINLSPGYDLDYDPINKIIFVPRQFNTSTAWQGMMAVSEYGSWKQLKYREGEWGTKWTFGTEANLSLYNHESDPAIAIDEEDAIWCVWTRQDQEEFSLKWDKTNSEKNLTPHLVDSVEIQWNIDKPHTLSFSCSEGHLFDPHNSMSTWNTFLRRGRLITVRMGEKISSINYWTNQGSYVIEAVSMSYERGMYPIIHIQCSDKSNVWQDGTIITTEYYDGQHPEYIIDQLLQTYAGLTVDEIDLPADGAMANSHIVWHQWIDMNLKDILEEFCNHFGYVSYMNMNGDASVKQIRFTGAPDHYYYDNETMKKFSPDDTFSNYINKVVVRGESHDFIEVLYDEELVGSIDGTMGWWGVTKQKQMRYSDDFTKTCRNPRIVEIEDPTISIFFVDFGGDGAWISDDDPEELWVEITIEGPDLIWVFVMSLIILLIVGSTAVGCDGEKYCGFMLFMLSIAMQWCASILAAEANYMYDVYAQPVGHEKQQVQSYALDQEMIDELNGLLVVEEIDDPFCYTVTSCGIVATHELNVVKFQRKRVQFEKIFHLQDEVGDVLQIPHPHSEVNLPFIITNLKRVYMKPQTLGEGGSVIDIIEGWRLSD